ncbi:MAG: hypothetical protein ACU0B7_10705 [Paracoccaceae bacterium]
MANPFLRRATEYVRDDASFLSIISPAPLTAFLANSPHKGEMFDLPVRIIGEPGSGKTMLAKLAEFRMVDTIARDLSSETHRDLAEALAAAGFLEDGIPRVAGVREPMESDYRDFWELPYDEGVRTKLALKYAQSRVVLNLIRSLTSNRRRTMGEVRFFARDASEAQVELIGGLDTNGIQERAFEVQKAIYSVVAGLRPPKLDDLPIEATSPYNPFEAISHIEIAWGGREIELSPLVMFDDVHALHPDQREALLAALAHREIRFGRWLMMRLDALSPGAALGEPGAQETHNLIAGRDYVDIRMQDRCPGRGVERRQFRTMALDMANRYLPLVQPLKNRGALNFQALLPNEAGKLSDGRLREIEVQVDKDQKKLEVSPSRREDFEELVDEYLRGANTHEGSPEIRLAMVRILMHRYANRIQHMTPSLFEEFDPDPKIPIKVNSGVLEGARVHLHHSYQRPLWYGVDDLCDASNENAETFLQLAGALVARMETLAIKKRSADLDAATQESALVGKATTIMSGWSFAYAARVRKMVDAIARECREVSMSPNARLGGGANAIAVPEIEMDQLLQDQEELADILKHALANGAISVRRNYGQGGKLWCLIELSGIVCIVYGLTLKRGGFLEKRITFLREVSN